jgi:Mrp family chromosome partitioning ATPase
VSRNFQLLQRIGNAEDIFRTTGEPWAAVPSKEEADACVDAGSPNKSASAETFPMQIDADGFTNCQDSSLAGTPKALPGNVRTPLASGKGRSRVGSSRVFPKVKPAKAAESRLTWERFLEGRRLAQGVRQTIIEWLSTLHRWPRSIVAVARARRWQDTAQTDVPATQRQAIIREEEMRLVCRVFPMERENAPRVALFSGLGEDAGSGAVCVRAARILATRCEGPVCAVDANFLSPSLHQYFCVENLRGLAEATQESGSIMSFAHRLEDNLWILPTGKTALQASLYAADGRLGERIAELRAAFRYVLIHASPLDHGAGSILVSRWTDGVVLFLEANFSTRVSAMSAKHRLAALNVSVLGVALNNRRFPIPRAIYGRL